MNTAAMCQSCGVSLSSYSNDGLCPACMLRSAFEELPADAPTASTRLGLPRAFGAYELLEEIGRGGMGVVYRARQRPLDRTVALKLLLGGAYSSEVMLRRFQIEAAAAAALHHPGIVAIHDYGECDGQPFYTMELMEGRNLTEVCEGRPLEARRAAVYLRAIGAAVQYAHERGILHRDLKPSNVLVDRDDRPRVADFGMAKRLDVDVGVTLTGQLVGSPNYAAPEQVSGRETDVGVATDVYALGALLYHLLTGRPPFLAATLEETLRLLHTAGPVAPRELNPGVTRDLETICLKCLAKESARRYATASAMVEDLDCFLEHRPIHARPPSFLDRARKYARRNRTIVVAAGAVFGALAVGLGVALIGFRRAVAQQRAAEAARAAAEELVGVIMHDVQPALEPYGRLPVMGKIAEASLGYFEGLPPELQNSSTDAAQAQRWMRWRWSNKTRGTTTRARWRSCVPSSFGRRLSRSVRTTPTRRRRCSWVSIKASIWFDQLNGFEALKAEGRPWWIAFARCVFVSPTTGRSRSGSRPRWSTGVMRLPHMGQPESLAGAREAHTLLLELLVEQPADLEVQRTYMVSFMSLTLANSRNGRADENLRLGEEAVAFAAEALKNDPGNLGLLKAASEAADILGHVSGNVVSSARPRSRARLPQIPRDADAARPDEPELAIQLRTRVYGRCPAPPARWPVRRGPAGLRAD